MARIIRVLFLAAIFHSLFSANVVMAQTGVIKGAHVGCLTEEDLNEYIIATSRWDFRHMGALLDKVCVSIEDREYSIMEWGFLKSRILVYTGSDSDSVILWTVTTALIQ